MIPRYRIIRLHKYKKGAIAIPIPSTKIGGESTVIAYMFQMLGPDNKYVDIPVVPE